VIERVAYREAYDRLIKKAEAEAFSVDPNTVSSFIVSDLDLQNA
jgi:hypothetical protein